MNKRIISAALLGAVMFGTTSCDKEELISTENLPAAANTFLNEHFDSVKVLSVIREKEALSSAEYEVLLNNGVEIKFDKNGNWDEVEARDNTDALPTSFILTPIVTYVQANYEDAGINSIDKEKVGFDVELTNGLDLVFNTAGEFVRIDP